MTRIILIFTLFLTFSCGKKEEVFPFARPVTVAEQMGNDSEITLVNGDFEFDDIEVTRPVGNIPIPIIGGFIQEFANTFANLFVVLNNNWELDQEAPMIELPELDPDYIPGIQIKSVDFRIVKGSESRSNNPITRAYQWITNKKAKLDFVKKLHIYIATQEMWDNGEMQRVAWYDYDKEQLQNCRNRCLNFHLERGEDGLPLNLVPILNGQTQVYIIPDVEIHSAPKRKFKIKGNIDFQVSLKLPF